MMVKFKRDKDKDEISEYELTSPNDEISEDELPPPDDWIPEDELPPPDDEIPEDELLFPEDEDLKDEGDFDDEGEKEEEKPWISAFWDITKDVIIAFIIVLLIISSIYIYTGNWPPVVVVESDSMQHHDTESSLSVIDTGDLVLVKAIESERDVVSYMEGKRTGHETYSEWGDVLIYRKNGYSDITPVIHRAIVWLEYNETGHSFDIPELKKHSAPEEWDVLSGERRWYNLSGSIILKEIGYDKQNVLINLGNILNSYNSPDIEPHSGFITLGDHNKGNYDQSMLPDGHGGRVRPVKPQWVVGKARGEIPWFGLIKLYFQDPTITERAPSNSFTMLWVSLILIFAIPISIDIVLILLDRRREKLSQIGDENEDSENKEIEKEPGGEEGILNEENEDDQEPPPPENENE